VQAVVIHRISHALWRRGWRYLPRLMSFISRIVTNVDIHPGASIGRRLFIDHGACVVIGETAIVGDDVTFYHGVTLGGTTLNKGRRHPEIGNGVMVGAGAKILGAISLGENVRVGANSVVVEPVPRNCTVVGIPGKIVVSSPTGGINLNHHLIPDPVGKAIACLISRIDSMERILQNREMFAEDYQQLQFGECDTGSQVCGENCSCKSVTSDRAANNEIVAKGEKDGFTRF
jgi:serine O-acetyltransferase